MVTKEEVEKVFNEWKVANDDLFKATSTEETAWHTYINLKEEFEENENGN